MGFNSYIRERNLTSAVQEDILVCSDPKVINLTSLAIVMRNNTPKRKVRKSEVDYVVSEERDATGGWKVNKFMPIEAKKNSSYANTILFKQTFHSEHLHFVEF